MLSLEDLQKRNIIEFISISLYKFAFMILKKFYGTIWRMNCAQIIAKLKSHQNPQNIAGMARFGINPKNTLGVSIPILRKLAKDIKAEHRIKSRGVKIATPPRCKKQLHCHCEESRTKSREDEAIFLHKLAQQLWNSKIHEARILAGMIDVPELVTPKQMDTWVADFDSWDVCDQVCMNLFDKTPFAYDKAKEWTKDKREYVKRAGFAMMAVLAWHDKKAEDEKLLQFFPIIKRESTDERNYVRKAVNWALRQIGKRNSGLRKKAIKLAEEIEKIDSKSARWIAKDALRELRKKH